MANFKQVNAAIKAKFPNVKVEAVRAFGYVYFATGESFSEPESIMCHPVNTTTELLTKWCIEQIEDWLPKLEESKVIVAAAKQSHAEHIAAQPVASDEASPANPRKEEAKSPEVPQYTAKQHKAIAAIMDQYREGISEKGRHNAYYSYGGKVHDNAVFISVHNLDALCELEPLSSQRIKKIE